MGLFDIGGGKREKFLGLAEESRRDKLIEQEKLVAQEEFLKTGTLTTSNIKKKKRGFARRGKQSAEDIRLGQRLALEEQAKRKQAFAQTGHQLGRGLGGFAGAAPQEDFSFQEDVLRQTVGGRGDKIWGTIGEPVTIHNDLNSSRRDPDDETSSMFGF